MRDPSVWHCEQIKLHLNFAPYNLQTEMLESVLAFVRAIVKSAHLNMNKSCAVGLLARLFVHLLIHVSIRRSSATTAAACISVRLSAECFTRAHLWIA